MLDGVQSPDSTDSLKNRKFNGPFWLSARRGNLALSPDRSGFNCHGSEPRQEYLTEPGNGRQLNKTLCLEHARARSILISDSEPKEEKVLSPPLTSGGGEGEGYFCFKL